MIAPAKKPAPRFTLGRILATPGAIAAMEEAGNVPAEFLDRHVRGDWEPWTTRTTRPTSRPSGVELASSACTILEAA